ncbi:ATP-binding protein [Thiohalomonas denitrificans]|uniref:ATP-binding protein n=1 Tax=Thiohalomonas denitrificans TaxID=415747 RepID=UPI0026F0EECE|nr:ATP-binding protein [Thiohalomonas denitrificans]
MGKKADVTVHIDEELDDARTSQVCSTLEGVNGIQRVRCAEHQKHLIVVEFDPDAVDSHAVLDHVQRQGLHAELIGL